MFINYITMFFQSKSNSHWIFSFKFRYITIAIFHDITSYLSFSSSTYSLKKSYNLSASAAPDNSATASFPTKTIVDGVPQLLAFFLKNVLDFSNKANSSEVILSVLI